MGNNVERPLYIKDYTSSHDNLSFGETINIGEKNQDNDFFSEKWLQDLIHKQPQCLPVAMIEPAFDDIIPVCRELPTKSGFLDNLYVTPSGYLVLVECKLWRNPDARRKVVAQIMDYAKDFSTWNYDDLLKAIRSVNKSKSDNPLYDLVKDNVEAIDEANFVDKVSRNLSKGRHLLLVVGDGIKEGVEELADFIQQHMGLHFTLALIELKLYRLLSNKDLLIIPNVIAKAVSIERAVIRLDDQRLQLIETNQQKTTTKSAPKSLTEEQFFESLEDNMSGGAEWLRNILSRLEDLGVSWEIKMSLILRLNPTGEMNFNLGYFGVDGRLWTSAATWAPDKLGRVELAHQYLYDLADIIPNAFVREHETAVEWLVKTNKSIITINDIKGHEDEFISVIEKYLLSIKEAGLV